MRKLLFTIIAGLMYVSCFVRIHAQNIALVHPRIPLLIPCEACNQDGKGKYISKRSASCPSCGHPTVDSVGHYMIRTAIINGAKDLTPLLGSQNVRRLEELYLDKKQIITIKPLESLTNLKVISLIGNHVTDLSPLAGLKNLEVLNLMENQVKDLRPLAGLKKLKVLNLRGNRVADLAPLAELKNLEELNLWQNQAKDLKPLEGFKKLKILDLWQNRVTDVRSLSGLTNLQELNLLRNRITDLRALAGLKNLKSLSVSGEIISTTQKNMLRKALPNCLIKYKLLFK